MSGAPQHDRWRRIDDLFQAALDCQPENRAAFLNAACQGDEPLLRDIESLLAAYERGGFTDAPAFQDGMRLLDFSGAEFVAGRCIGPFRIIREIGRGGMGAVYLGSRADQAFEMQVAIKLIRRGHDTEDVIRRFRSERQILASLDHPNITRLLDGGTTQDGLPYFVMEYIEGQPIDTYCDSLKLNVTERLKLFQKVCAAVHYAHQHLVIHRDIKPGNILVTKEGVPRLLDFGIAKMLVPESVSEQTITVVRAMTPEYASPEQVRSGAITTASDVYSLGVLLYKLLTGHRPYRLAGKSPTEVERAICEQDPEPPSTAIDHIEDSGVDGAITPQFVAEMREGSLEKLQRLLRGDLDKIVLKALCKEPARRYSSAEQLSEDVRRHLEGLPVHAHATNWSYRTGKFIRRHRVGVTAAGLILFSLLAGIASTMWQAKVAIAERERARVESAKAQRINAFLQDMLSSSSPGFLSSNPRKNPDAKVSEVIEQAASRAESELADQPEVLAEMQRTIGAVYYAQGRYDQAEQILRAALEKYVRLYGADGHETVEASNLLANTLLRKGNNAEAEARFRHGIDVERREVQRGHVDTRILTRVLGDYGSMLDQMGDKATEAYLREALQYASKLTGKERVYVAMIDNDLGDVAYRRGDLDESERMGRAAIDEYRKLPEGTYVEMATTLSNVGAVLIKKGKYEQAEPLVREGLELREKLLGDAHPDTAMSLFRLSDLLYRKGEYQAAESAARESVQVFTRALTTPTNNVYFANPLLELGLILNKTGRYREAESNLREALELRNRLLPPGNPLIALTEGVLGECLTAQRRYAEAEPLLQRSYATAKALQGEHGASTLEASRRLTVLYDAWGKPERAAQYKTASTLASTAFVK